jgi:hypothetical protein
MAEWELVRAADADAILSGIADPLLADRGFRPVGRRRWVRSFPPVRHLFEVVPLKGASLVPCWGISLDFVPHVAANEVAWHRTEKSALRDLTFDPVDFYADWRDRWSIDGLRGTNAFRAAVERVLPAAVAEACAWLDDARDEPAALERARWLLSAKRPGGRFKFHNFVQQPLAYAILLARAGAREEGLRALDDWITSRGYQQLRDQLIALLGA